MSLSKVVASLAALAFTFVAGPAYAESADAKERARLLLEEGSAFLERGDPGRGLERFDEAFRVFPSPRIHFNRGLALRGLGRNAEAIESLRRFIAEATDAAERPRAQAREMLAELEKKVGWLEIACDTTDTELLVDGRRAVAGPFTGPVPVDAGERRLRLGRAGSGSAASAREVSRTLAPGQRTTLACGAATGETASSAGPSPPPGAPPSPPRSNPVPDATAATQPAPTSEPLTSRPWFWVAAAALVAGGVAAALFIRRPAELPRGTLGSQDLR